MARFNEILVGRFNNALRKMLGMKGAAPAPQAGGEFMPVLPFFYGPEFRFLEEWQRFANTGSQAASVGNVAGMRWRNPLGSNVIAVMEKLSFSVGVTSQINMTFGVQAADLTGGSMGNTRLDARGRPNAAILQTMQNNTAAIAGANVFAVTIQASTTYEMIGYENQELTILPGDALTLITNNTNVLFSCAAIWRERYLEESERQ